jgi:EpsI family protein
MNSILTRLTILIALVVSVHCGFILVRAGTRPAQVALPTRSIHELPRTLGTWHGEDAELDSKIFVGTAARDVVDRTYADRSGHNTSVFVALYDDPAAGVYHTPANCYRANGWTNLSDVLMPLESAGRPTVSVSLSTWESGSQRVQVVCWYEMGEHVLFDRLDWGTIQFKLRGQTTWPPMYKVLLQAQVTDSLTSARLLELAGSLRAWLGELTVTAEPAGRAP